jgi:hypothetical protein
MSEINEMITGVKREEKYENNNNSDDNDPKPENSGKLLVDAI